jgi:hypothetical protein
MLTIQEWALALFTIPDDFLIVVGGLSSGHGLSKATAF